MSQDGAVSPWSKLDPSVLATTDSDSSTGIVVNREPTERTRWWRVGWACLDAFSALFWIYALVKVFVADVDRWVITTVAPQLQWMLDFRLLILLVGLSLLLVFFKRRWWAWVPIYVSLFPLVFVLWKVPRFLYKSRSWTLLLGFAHVVTSSLRGIRFAVPTFTVLAVSAVLIGVNSPEPLLWLSIAMLLLGWLVTLGRAFFMAFRPSWFVRGQRRLFQAFLTSDRAWTLFSVSDVAPSGVEVYNDTQANQLLVRACSGLIAYRATQVWAMKVDEYRKRCIDSIRCSSSHDANGACPCNLLTHQHRLV